MEMTDETQSRVTQDEILRMAIQMEELGRDFYEALGGATRDPRVFQLCHRLAVEEDKHGEVFRRLHSDLAEQGRSVMLADEQTAANRRRLKERVMPTSDTIRQVACGGNVIDALNMAVKMEAESVRFYSRLAENLPPGNSIEAVIAEERTHLRLLSGVRCGLETGR
jgi:rubrerythrin